MDRRRAVVLVLAVLLIGCAHSSETAGKCSAQSIQSPSFTPAERVKGVRAVWQTRRHVNASSLEALRRQAWDMFDHGFSSYMKHAFPKDNLLPVSCGGQDWQGGLGLTLVDSLDMLLLLNRRGDVVAALEQLRSVLSFDKDVKVHVFETTIRVLGGLLSGHMLLADDPGLAPGYDGLLLRLAGDLGDRLLAAFDTPSGLPGGHVHLQKGLLPGENISCTACAGTLLLEFGLLSRLTGRPRYEDAARHAARVLYGQRSGLGLVGSGFHVFSQQWSHRDSTIGPGSDSYYEYLLKAYLMFGEPEYLSMFSELYVATMRHMQVPGQLGASSSAFLLDVHMDSGRLLKPWVSSLGAFWPAMQVLAGQHEAAARLHANFTAAWATWGWLPELFGADLGAVHPEEPGYNLRPEHIESTWYLKAVSGDPTGYYTGLAASMMEVLGHSRTACGYAPIRDVSTGAHTDLMESYFLSETVKYLYLSFVDSGPLLDHYLLSTEGHLMPAFGHASDPPSIEEGLPPPQQQQQQQEEAGQGDEEGAGAEQQDEAYHDGDQEGDWEKYFEYDDSHTRQQQQQQQRVEAKQQGAASKQGAAANTKQEGSSGSCTAAAPATNSSSNGTSNSSSNGTSNNSSSNSSSNATADSSAGVGATSSSLVGKPLGSLPANCRGLCEVRGTAEEAGYEARLHAALPLLPVRRVYSRRIRYRRCVACLHTTEALLAKPPDSLAVRLARLNFGEDPSSSSSKQSSSSSPAKQSELQPAGSSVLAQVLCVLKVYKSGRVSCQTIRRLTALDNAVGLAPGTLLLQLTALQPEPAAAASVLLTSFETDDGPVVMPLAAAEASFGPRLPQLPDSCVDVLLTQRPQASLLALPCPPWPPGEPPAYLRRPLRYAVDGGKRRAVLQQQQREVGRAGEPWWQVLARAADPWLGMSPREGLCEQLAAQLAGAQQAPDVRYEAQRAAEAQQQCVAVHGARPGDAQDAGINQQQQQQPGGVAAQGECVAAHEAEAAEQEEVCGSALGLHTQRSSANQRLSAAALSSWGLRAACLGWDAASEAGGGWLLPSEWGAAGSSCASMPAGSHMPRAAPLVLAEPLDGCKGLRNAALLRGAVAVVGRGRCSFLDKAMVADAAGAVGLVVMNTAPPGELLTMSGDETGRSPDIPAVLLGGEDSRALLWWLEHRPMVGALAALQDGSGQAQQMQAGKDKQQQQQKQAKTKKQSHQQQQQYHQQQQQTRVDLFVPGRSQAWLTEHVVKAGINAQRIFEQVVRDPAVVAALQQAAAGRP
uniref:alpha-1,2-Mannosidase n=1 Tax=Tetradesmus obliquus TaxID=3088 RepID=A0A383VV16_TETOB|eukprot:jgi/Sobl393_1/6917/SZX69338.1